MTKYGSPKERRRLLKIVRKRRLCTLLESSMHKRNIWPRLQQQHMPLVTFFAKSKGCFRTLPKLLNWRLSANFTLMTFFFFCGILQFLADQTNLFLEQVKL